MRRGCSRSTTVTWILTALVIASAGVAGCSSSGTTKMGLIAVDPNGQRFVEAKSGQPFVPFGTNYYDPNTGWSPKIWQQFNVERVTYQFGVMNKLGVNCARVFLTAATFQPDVNTINRDALAKLDAMIKIARDANVRLILTGPDHWEGSPEYWKPDRYAGENALTALDNFWRTIGRRYKGNPTILAWDLLNEPEMPWFVEGWQPQWNAWLTAKYNNREGLKAAWGDELGADEQMDAIKVPEDVAKKDNLRLLDWQLFREHLADNWVKRQVDVLRKADPTHMITIGYIQWSFPVVRPGNPSVYSAFNPHRQAQWLDFVSVHFYPLMGQPFDSRESWQKNLAYLQTMLAYCQTEKPLVLGEYGWYGGGAPERRPFLDEDQQTRWILAEIEASRRLVRGWLSWPFADTPESTDMSIYGGLVRPNMGYKIWAWWFRTYASALSILPQPTPPLPPFDVTPSLTTPVNDLPAMFEENAALVQGVLRQAGAVPRMPTPNIGKVKPLE